MKHLLYFDGLSDRRIAIGLWNGSHAPLAIKGKVARTASALREVVGGDRESKSFAPNFELPEVRHRGMIASNDRSHDIIPLPNTTHPRIMPRTPVTEASAEL